MTPQVALVTTGRYYVTVRIRKCNVCYVNKHYIPTRGVLFLCCHVQHVACSMLIEPKMSSGGRRSVEKSSCAHIRFTKWRSIDRLSAGAAAQHAQGASDRQSVRGVAVNYMLGITMN